MAGENRELEASQRRVSNYANWHDACKASRFGKAVSREAIKIKIPRGTFTVRILKPMNGDAWAVYASAEGIKVHDWKATSAVVDAVSLWRPW